MMPDELDDHVTTADLTTESDPTEPTTAAPPEPAAQASTPPAAEVLNPFAGEKDIHGREFHPAKFRLGEDGKPKRDSLKRFIPLGLGGAKKSPGGTPPSPTPAASGSRLPPDDTVNAVAAGEIEFTAELGVEVALGLIQAALIMIGRDEGILDDLEKKMLRTPLLRILAKYNLKDKMTPELELIGVLAVVILKRLKKPNTQNWFQEKLAGLRGWWVRRKIARATDSVPAAT